MALGQDRPHRRLEALAVEAAELVRRAVGLGEDESLALEETVAEVSPQPLTQRPAHDHGPVLPPSAHNGGLACGGSLNAAMN